MPALPISKRVGAEWEPVNWGMAPTLGKLALQPEALGCFRACTRGCGDLAHVPSLSGVSVSLGFSRHPFQCSFRLAGGRKFFLHAWHCAVYFMSIVAGPPDSPAHPVD